MWAPDGSAVAFDRRLGGRLTLPDPSPVRVGVYVGTANGAATRRLFRSFVVFDVLGWTRDSKRIVFDAGETQAVRAAGGAPRPAEAGLEFVDANGDGWVVELDGGVPVREVAQRPAPGRLRGKVQPVWSPDGTQFAFTSVGTGPDSRHQISVANADGSGRRALTRNTENVFLSSPRWSPGGTELVYAGDTLTVVSLADGSSRELTRVGNYSDSCPTWSPAGDTIAFLRRWGGGFGGTGWGVVMLVGADGSGLRRLPDDL